AFVLNRGKNVYIGNLSFRDRLQTHLSLERSVRVLISNVSIRAPQQSPNTDGMHLQQSRYVLIEDSHIRTGDDCVLIGVTHPTSMSGGSYATQ
ncbi:hypothetical protein CRG98_049957, partial [Punica granatum]